MTQGLGIAQTEDVEGGYLVRGYISGPAFQEPLPENRVPGFRQEPGG